MHGLYTQFLYEQKGQDLNADITLKKVLKLNQSQLIELQAALNNQLNQQLGIAPSTDAPVEDEAAKKEEELIDDSKVQAEAKSRASKRGTITQMGKSGNQAGSSKSPKSPGISVTKSEDQGLSLKERIVNSELAINKSIYMKTAYFLIKYNAFAVSNSYYSDTLRSY